MTMSSKNIALCLFQGMAWIETKIHPFLFPLYNYVTISCLHKEIKIIIDTLILPIVKPVAFQRSGMLPPFKDIKSDFFLHDNALASPLPVTLICRNCFAILSQLSKYQKGVSHNQHKHVEKHKHSHQILSHTSSTPLLAPPTCY